jgi:hypothetical protein
MKNKFKDDVLKDYYEWFNRNSKELSKLEIQERINKYLEYERRSKK